jgi:hypothetical protein
MSSSKQTAFYGTDYTSFTSYSFFRDFELIPPKELWSPYNKNSEKFEILQGKVLELIETCFSFCIKENFKTIERILWFDSIFTTPIFKEFCKDGDITLTRRLNKIRKIFHNPLIDSVRPLSDYYSFPNFPDLFKNLIRFSDKLFGSYQDDLMPLGYYKEFLNNAWFTRVRILCLQGHGQCYDSIPSEIRSPIFPFQEAVKNSANLTRYQLSDFPAKSAEEFEFLEWHRSVSFELIDEKFDASDQLIDDSSDSDFD